MELIALLRGNRNYRNMWLGQVVSEVGDHFNNIAVFALAMRYTNGGAIVAGVLISRAIPMLLAGPLAGVVLDRFDRKRIMIASDLVRFIVAILFIPIARTGHTWPLYVLSAILMAASPFFTSGRASILPSIANKEELHTANSVTQTTQWATTDQTGRFYFPDVYVARRWALIFPPIERFSSSFGVIFGLASCSSVASIDPPATFAFLSSLLIAHPHAAQPSVHSSVVTIQRQGSARPHRQFQL